MKQLSRFSILFLLFYKISFAQITVEKDSLLHLGIIQNGLKEGKWIYYDKMNNVVQICNYKDNKLEGECYLFNENHLVIKINLEKGIIYGKAYFYSKEGDVLAIYNYFNGIRGDILFYIANKESPSRDHLYTPKSKMIR